MKVVVVVEKADFSGIVLARVWRTTRRTKLQHSLCVCVAIACMACIEPTCSVRAFTLMCVRACVRSIFICVMLKMSGCMLISHIQSKRRQHKIQCANHFSNYMANTARLRCVLFSSFCCVARMAWSFSNICIHFGSQFFFCTISLLRIRFCTMQKYQWLNTQEKNWASQRQRHRWIRFACNHRFVHTRARTRSHSYNSIE